MVLLQPPCFAYDVFRLDVVAGVVFGFGGDGVVVVGEAELEQEGRKYLNNNNNVKEYDWQDVYLQ